VEFFSPSGESLRLPRSALSFSVVYSSSLFPSRRLPFRSFSYPRHPSQFSLGECVLTLLPQSVKHCSRLDPDHGLFVCLSFSPGISPPTFFPHKDNLAFPSEKEGRGPWIPSFFHRLFFKGIGTGLSPFQRTLSRVTPSCRGLLRNSSDAQGVDEFSSDCVSSKFALVPSLFTFHGNLTSWIRVPPRLIVLGTHYFFLLLGMALFMFAGIVF